MKVSISKQPHRVIADITVEDYFGKTQEFTSVDITDHKVMWVATDKNGEVFLFDYKPTLEHTYWEHSFGYESYHPETGIELLVQESETMLNEPCANFKDTLVEIQVG